MMSAISQYKRGFLAATVVISLVTLIGLCGIRAINQKPKEMNHYEGIWNARMNALRPILGKPEEVVCHAYVPLELGGFADVVPFTNYVPGVTYVTADLTGQEIGQLPSSLGHYELMVCVRQESQRAADLISRLARYTCDAKVEAGDTMDLGTFFEDSTLRALLFTHPRGEATHFEFLGKRYGLLLCVGITAEELAFGRSKGTEKLLSLLKEHGVFPYTIPDRPSVALPVNRL
jgi:hypothetical protein